MQTLNNRPTGDGMERHPGKLWPANSGVIDLTGAIRVGQGNGRDCYVHPLDDGLVIKVRRQDRVTRNQNTLEWIYLSSLARRRVPFDHIPQLHGMVATKLGEGLVCERITASPAGQACLSLTETVRQGLLTPERSEALLGNLRVHLLRHWIVLADANERNLMWQQPAGRAGRLVIIDGFGARHFGVKLWLYCHVPFFARRKTRKVWPRLLDRVRSSYS